MTDDKSIKSTLNLIRKALEDDDSNSLKIEDNILILNKLVKEDGTIDIINNKFLQKDEVKEILSQKISEIFKDHFDTWLDKNIPDYLDKYFKNKYDLLENINQYFDHQIMIKIKSIDQSTPRDMLFEIIMLRFDLLNKHRKSILRIFNFFKKNPRNFIFLIPCFINSSELMSNIANIKIKGFKGRIRIKGVLVVYLSTFLTWVNDDSFSLDKTMNVLDNYLKKFEGIAKLIH